MLNGDVLHGGGVRPSASDVVINQPPLPSQDVDQSSRLFLRSQQLEETQVLPSTEVASSYRDLLQSSSSEGEEEVDVVDTNIDGGEEEHTSKTIESIVESVHSDHDNGELSPLPQAEDRIVEEEEEEEETAPIQAAEEAVIKDKDEEIAPTQEVEEAITIEDKQEETLPAQETAATGVIVSEEMQQQAVTVEDKQEEFLPAQETAAVEEDKPQQQQPQEEEEAVVEQQESQMTSDAAALLLQVAASTASAVEEEEEEEAPVSVRKNQPRRASQFKTPQQPSRNKHGPTPPSITKAYNEKVYASCWAELLAMGWKAKPWTKNLESSWCYMTPEARALPSNEYVDGVNVFFSESALLDYIKATFPDIYRRAQRDKKHWQKKWTDQSPASAESMQKKTRAKQPKFNEVWQALKDVGWDWAKIAGDWCYVVPEAPLQQKDQLVRGRNYFTTKDELLEYLEHTGEMPLLEESEEAESSSAQEEPVARGKTRYLLKNCLPVFEKDLWFHLETEMDWTYCRGAGLVEYEFYLPNARTRKDGGKRNVDYFESRDKVYEYVSKHPEHLKGLVYEGKDMSELEYTNDPFDRALAETPKKLPTAAVTPVKRAKPRVTKTPSSKAEVVVESFDREFDLKVLLPKFERDLWVHLQEEMGWRYEHGSGLVEYEFYLPGGKAKKDGGVRNQDYFESEDRVYEYAAMHPEQLLGLQYKGRDMSTLKYAAKQGRRSLPSSRNATTPATESKQVARTTSTKKRPAAPQASSLSKKKKKRMVEKEEVEDATTPWTVCWQKLVQRGWTKDEAGTFYAPGYDASNIGAENESNFASQSALWSWIEENDQMLFQQCVDQGSSNAAAAAAADEEEDGEADEEMTPVRGVVKRSRYFEEPAAVAKVNEDEEERRREREAISTKEGENRIRQFNVSLSTAAVPVVKSPQKPRAAPQQQALRPITTSTGLFKGMVFFLTGMEQDVAETMQRAITQQQGKLSNDVWGVKPSTSAILLCQPGSFRTSTYLAALARRLPILHPNWLWTCIQENRLVMEYHSFEIPNSFVLHPTKSLLPADSSTLEHVPSSSWNSTANDDMIFQDMTFQILDNARPIQRLVEAMGGKVVSSSDEQDDSVIFLTPIEAYTDDIALRMMRRRPVYTFEWVAQCLLHGKRLTDKPAHCWFHPTPPPSTAVTRLLENDSEHGLIKPLVISLPQANSMAPVVSVEIFQLRGKRYYVGDFVLVCDPADGEPAESTATFGRVRKIEFDVDALKYRLSVDVFHRAPNTTLSILQWRKSRPRMEFDATSILQKFVCVPIIGDTLEQAQAMCTQHVGCCCNSVDWKDSVYVLY